MSKTCKPALLALVALLWSGVAAADGWPANVTGTWNIVGNQSLGTLTINQFPGALGSQCKPIRGTIYVAGRVEGFYCPGSGRISFIRTFDGVANQYWSGNLSQVGQVLRIGGSFAAFPHNNVAGTIGGSLGEYNFSATK